MKSKDVINVVLSIGTMIEPVTSIFFEICSSITKILGTISILSFVVLLYYQIIYSKNSDLKARFEKMAEFYSSMSDGFGQPYINSQLHSIFSDKDLKKLERFGYIKRIESGYKIMKYF